MSEEIIKQLNDKIVQLEAQFKNSTEQLNGASAQLDAHKQMLGESIQSALNLRTCVIMFQKSINEFENKLKEKEKQIAGMNQMIADLTANNAKLEAKIKELQPVEVPVSDAA